MQLCLGLIVRLCPKIIFIIRCAAEMVLRELLGRASVLLTEALGRDVGRIVLLLQARLIVVW